MKKFYAFLAVFLALTMLTPLFSFAGGADIPDASISSDGTPPSETDSQSGLISDTDSDAPSGVSDAFAQFTAESDARALILIEAETGTVLYEKNADAPLPPASVTKIMTMLLVMEAIDSGKISADELVTVSETAAKMGGSQVFLEPGEQMTVSELLKCVTVASANDACVALAEHISGSEEAFVSLMNQRAAELGMTHTSFENTNGLDDTTVNHVISARDISIMSRELITKHEKILEYSSIWMDSIRGGQFGLTNTNRLIRFYQGANGLKTGSTSKAKFCISASAKRGGMQLICVVMGASTRDSRNEIAKKLFDYGFANFTYESFSPAEPKEIEVIGGGKNTLSLTYEGYETLTDKGNAGKIKEEILLPEKVTAPIKAGDVIGTVKYAVGDTVLAEIPIKAAEDVGRISFFGLLSRLFNAFIY